MMPTKHPINRAVTSAIALSAGFALQGQALAQGDTQLARAVAERWVEGFTSAPSPSRQSL